MRDRNAGTGRRGQRLALLLAPVALALAVWVVATQLLDDGTSAEPTGADAVVPPPVAAPAAERAEAADLPAGTPEPVAEDPGALPQAASADAARALVPEGGESGPSLLLELLHADGRPATGARVVLARGGRVLDGGTADTRGRVRLDGTDSGAAVWVGGACSPAQRFVFEPAVGSQTVRLAPGGLVEGRVTVDGRAPGEPLALSLHGDGLDDPLVPAHVRKALMRRRGPRWDGGRGVATDAEGHFLVSGLPAGWSGELRFDRPPYQIEGRSLWLGLHDWPAVTANAGRVQLDLVRVPSLRGRLVDEVGRPVEGAVSFELDQEGLHLEATTHTDADGRFAQPVDAGPVERLAIAHKSSAGNVQLEFRDLEVHVRDGLDLGELVIEGGEDVIFLVRDVNGAPVEGAVGIVDDETLMDARWRSAPTDSFGRGRVKHVPADAETLVVHAPRHRSTSAPLTSDRTEHVRVRMEPCASLDVTVVGPHLEPGGYARPRLELDAVAAPALFARPDHGELTRRRLTPKPGAPPPPERWRLRQGRLPLSKICGCFEPGIPFRLELLDSFDHLVETWEEPALAPGEWRTRTLTTDAIPRDLRVDVRDLAGVRLTDASARVYVRAKQEGRGLRSLDGHLVAKQLVAETVSLLVQAPGHASAWLDDVVVPADGSPVVVTLGPPSEVLLELLTHDGRPAPIDVAKGTWGAYAATAAGESLRVRGWQTPHGILYEDLPAAPVSLRVRVGGTWYGVDADGRVGEAKLVLPEGVEPQDPADSPR